MDLTNPTDLIIVSIAIIIVVAILYFFLRWALSVKRQLWNQQQIISVLLKIADKLGVPKDEVSTIEEKNNTPTH